MLSTTTELVYIVTGTTRGIGKSLAEAIVAGGQKLYSLSRAPEKHDGVWLNVTCDLRFPDQMHRAMARIIEDLEPGGQSEMVLICNAGVLAPVGFLDQLTVDQIAAHMQVNLLSPMQLMGHFIKATDGWPCSRRILLITSGAARRSYAGWSPYCSSKAGLEMVMRCAALEQQRRTRGVIICAVAPGVVETGMQEYIRNVSVVNFPARSRFVDLHANRQLESPQRVAGLLLELDSSGQFAASGLYDLRDVQWRQGRPVIEPRELVK